MLLRKILVFAIPILITPLVVYAGLYLVGYLISIFGNNLSLGDSFFIVIASLFGFIALPGLLHPYLCKVFKVKFSNPGQVEALGIIIPILFWLLFTGIRDGALNPLDYINLFLKK